MAQHAGITLEQARKLLELAKKATRQCKVRTIQKDGSQHAGRAFLLDVVGKHSARIKPFNHGKEEVVPLEHLRLWKAGNQFDIGPVEDMEDEDMTALANAPVGGLQLRPAQRGEFCIISDSMEMVWCGDARSWKSEPQLGVVYQDSLIAEKAVQRVNKTPMTRDARVVPRSEALTILGVKMSAPKFVPAPSPVQGPVVISRPPEPPMKTPTSTPSPAEQTVLDFSQLTGLDINSMLETDEDEELLVRAKANLREAAEKYKIVAQQFQLITDQVKKANHTVNEIELRMRDKIIARMNEENKGSRARGPYKPRGAKRPPIKQEVIKILKTHSRLDTKSIMDKISIVLPGASPTSVYPCLTALKTEGLAEKDENGGWALTAAGRAYDPDAKKAAAE